jgi:hypothetical protein
MHVLNRNRWSGRPTGGDRKDTGSRRMTLKVDIDWFWFMAAGDPLASHPSAPAFVRGQLHARLGRYRSPGARSDIDEPEILMLNLSSQQYKGSPSRPKGQVSSPPSQGQGGQGIRRALGRGSFDRKRGADIGSRVDNEMTAGGPRRINRVPLDKNSRGAAVDRHAEQVWDAVIVHRRGDRLAVGRPCWSALQVERIGHNPGVRAVGPHPYKSDWPCCRIENAICRHRGRLPGRRRLALPRLSTTRCQFR